MATTDNSFTDNMQAVSNQYATAAGVETDEDGKVPHIDVENSVVEEEPAEPETPVDPETPADPDDLDDADPDDLTEEELEAATAPEGTES